ncbi:MAG TPA: tRNA adenosine(34) deaminase TadA [Bacillota bacterium]|nr:MAG: tRNA-specific adenosine deaminase [Firmicutes bacterium ADurb.Bin153]HNV34869.1 tRNA adenosine(34) deaminase TadA [Bacillota bacterium]HPU95892.1 tRNA adenosine(34) deaminase TadA [Bacillota bacterium]
MSESGTSHRKFMAIAIEEAKQALAEGEVPVGACIVMDREVIARAHNMREGYSDSTAHAEMLVIREASSRLGRWRLSDCTLYVTLEPCAMCAGAVVQARLGTLVFGAFDDKAGAVGSLYDIPRDFRLNHFVEVVPGIMSEETSELMKGFFTGRR